MHIMWPLAPLARSNGWQDAVAADQALVIICKISIHAAAGEKCNIVNRLDMLPLLQLLLLLRLLLLLLHSGCGCCRHSW
jgi:hypothetical protein